MLSTSKNVLFPIPNRWFAGGYDLQIGQKCPIWCRDVRPLTLHHLSILFSQVIVKRLFDQDEQTKQELAKVKAEKEGVEEKAKQLTDNLETTKKELGETQSSGEKLVRNGPRVSV